VILVGIGANLESRVGPPRQTAAAALAALAEAEVRPIARSPWYESAPVPASDQPWYLNAVAIVATVLPPNELLHLLLAIEARFGRRRRARNAARVLDLDLLDYDGIICRSSALILPHPRMHQRRFVLAPLGDIAPGWRHQILGQSAAELLAGLPPGQPIRRLGE